MPYQQGQISALAVRRSPLRLCQGAVRLVIDVHGGPVQTPGWIGMITAAVASVDVRSRWEGA